MLFRSDAVLIPAGEDCGVVLAEVLSLLDPNEVAKIQYVATGADDDDPGLYLVVFDSPQIFDPDCFAPEVWEQIEDASEQMGLIESHCNS